MSASENAHAPQRIGEPERARRGEHRIAVDDHQALDVAGLHVVHQLPQRLRLRDGSAATGSIRS